MFFVILPEISNPYLLDPEIMAASTSYRNFNDEDFTITPGQFVQDALETKSITQKDLSLMLGKSASVINDIIKGKRLINAEIAVLLEAVTDIKAAVWMDVQSKYVIAEAYRNEGILTRYSKIKDWLKIKPFINLSILKKILGIKGAIEDVDKLLSYAGVTSADEFCSLPERKIAKFRKSSKMQTDVQNLFTWTLIARHQSKEKTLTSFFDQTKIEELSNKLNDIFFHNFLVEDKVEEVLNQYGIKFFRIKNFERTPVDGYSFWDGTNPTIVVTKRYDRIDNFAFNIFHELGHIYHHLTPNSTEDYIGSNGDDDSENDSHEREANEFAKKQLRRGINLDRIFARWNNPFVASNLLKGISEDYRINLGIVTGQYQNYCSNYTICRNFLEKVN